MKLDYAKIELVMARHDPPLTRMALGQQANKTTESVCNLLDQIRMRRDIAPARAGWLARGLGVDVESILEDPPRTAGRKGAAA